MTTEQKIKEYEQKQNAEFHRIYKINLLHDIIWFLIYLFSYYFILLASFNSEYIVYTFVIGLMFCLGKAGDVYLAWVLFNKYSLD